MANSYLNDEFFNKMETLALNLQTNLSGFFGGKHRTNSYGQTVEFSDYREYMLGDDIRRIDWNLYSRFEKHFIKLFTDERQMHVQIFLDCSASMAKADPNKAEYAVGVAAALGFLAVHNMDKLSFNLIKGNLAENNNGTIIGKNTFFRSLKSLENIDFSESSNIAEAITNSPDVGTKDGITVIISDFLSDGDWKKAIDFLTFKKRQVLLIQVLTIEEEDPGYTGRTSLIDAESEDLLDDRNMKLKITRGMLMAYQEALTDFKADIKSYCLKHGADFISVRTDKPIEKVLFSQLLGAGIMV